jgi:flagellar capping protein FliD
MSLEARVQFLEEKYDALDHGFRENNKILEATHGVVSLVLNEQQGMRKELFEVKRQVDHLDQKLVHMDQKFTHMDQKFESRFDQLETLTRQLVPNARQ